MNCPHCGVEVVVGKKLCSACGRTVASRPAFLRSAAAAPAAPPTETSLPQPTPAAVAPLPDASPSSAVCRVCFETFERSAGEVAAPICPKCLDVRPPAADAGGGGGDSTTRPATQDPPDGPPRRDLSRPRRLAPIEPPRSSTPGAFVVAGVALAACLVCVAVVVARGGKEPTSQYFVGVKADDATFVVAPSHGAATRIETTSRLTLVHQGAREAVANRLDELLRLDQKTVQTADVSWVKDDADGVLLDATAECLVALQTGTAPGANAKEFRAYPWDGFRGTARLVVPASGPEQVVGAGMPVVGRDVPPCLTLHDVGAPSGAVAAGATWKAPITMPLLATRDGAVFPVAFPCELKYLGRRTTNGVPTYALSANGVAPSMIPAELADMNRASGTLHAALFFEAKTGLLVEAHATVDASVWQENGRVVDRVRVSGTLDAKRP